MKCHELWSWTRNPPSSTTISWNDISGFTAQMVWRKDALSWAVLQNIWKTSDWSTDVGQSAFHLGKYPQCNSAVWYVMRLPVTSLLLPFESIAQISQIQRSSHSFIARVGWSESDLRLFCMTSHGSVFFGPAFFVICHAFDFFGITCSCGFYFVILWTGSMGLYSHDTCRSSLVVSTWFYSRVGAVSALTAGVRADSV